MKKPSQYNLKKWLYNNPIKGIEVEYRQTGIDTADTWWKVKTRDKAKTLKADTVEDLIVIEPTHAYLAFLDEPYGDEVEAYDKFCEENEKDLAEFERLKKKFGKEV